jgi:hypothetical protein
MRCHCKQNGVSIDICPLWTTAGNPSLFSVVLRCMLKASKKHVKDQLRITYVISWSILLFPAFIHSFHNLKMAAFWRVPPCILAEFHRRFICASVPPWTWTEVSPRLTYRPDDRGSKHLWNACKLLAHNMTLQPKRHPKSFSDVIRWWTNVCSVMTHSETQFEVNYFKFFRHHFEAADNLPLSQGCKKDRCYRTEQPWTKEDIPLWSIAPDISPIRLVRAGTTGVERRGVTRLH